VRLAVFTHDYWVAWKGMVAMLAHLPWGILASGFSENEPFPARVVRRVVVLFNYRVA
jgi:hypothetical protein